MGAAVRPDVVHQHRLPFLSRPARDALPHADPDALDRRHAIPDRLLDGQEALLGIGEEEKPGADPEERAGLLHREIDDSTGVELAPGGAYDRRERVKLGLIVAGARQRAARLLPELGDQTLAFENHRDDGRIDRRMERRTPRTLGPTRAGPAPTREEERNERNSGAEAAQKREP